MTTPPGNPFGIPGFGSADGANPVAQSLDMMRQVWSGLSAAAPISPAMSTEELDRRITDLRAIENWLDLNLKMLRGAIQGLEVQRATISTLRSFAQAVNNPYVAQPGAEAGAAQSPLEAVLGLNPGGKRPGAAPEAAAADAPPAGAPLHGLPAAQAWWSMLQDQFGRIATAATPDAARPSAEPAAKPARPAPRKRAASRKTATAKPPRGKA